MAADERERGDPDADARDELLFIRCQLGDPGAFDALVDRWHEPLWRYVRRLCADDERAADALQDVWLRVLRALPALREPARARAWLFGIARRALMDDLRRRYVQPETVDIDEQQLPEPERDEELEEELATMHVELASLPLIEREVLVLFYLRELSLDGIAEVTGVPVGTVKSRLHRARRLLRARIEQSRSAP